MIPTGDSGGAELKRYSTWPLVAVLCLLGLCISWLAFNSVARQHDGRLEADFRRDVDRRVAQVEQRMSQMIEQLRSISAFYLSSTSVDAQEFRDFTAGYLRKELGLEMVAWARVQYPNQSGDGQLDSDSPVDGVSLPLLYVEPGPSGRFDFGFDLVTEVPIRDALAGVFERGYVQYVIEPESLVFVTTTLDSVDWSGVVMAVLPLEIVAQWMDADGLGAALRIVEATTGDVVLARGTVDRSDGSYQTSVKVAGEIWQVELWGGVPSGFAIGAWATLFAGTAITGLLSVLIVSLTSTADRARQIVLKRTRELAQAEQEARAQAVRLADEVSHTHQVISSIPSLLIGVNAAGVITEWNRAVEHLSGIPASRAVGQLLAACGWGGDLRRIVDAGEACLRDSEPKSSDRLVMAAAHGQDATVALTYTPFHTSGDRLDGCLIIGNDVTEQNIMEVQLREAQRLEAVGRLASGIAHEVNTPAQFVSDNTTFLKDAFADLIELEAEYSRVFDVCGDAISDQDRAALQRARESADREYLMEEVPLALEQSLDGIRRIANIVRAMKEFSHPGSGGHKEQADLNHLIKNAITVSANEWKYHATVETDLDEDLPAVMCYPRELNQVVLNLLINGAHAIASRVGDSGERGVLRIATSVSGDSMRMSISDTGTGIPEHARSKIFEPFFTTKPVGEGSGQGLALAYSAVVEQHNGEITFETEAGVGTTFFVSLPLEPQEAAA